MSVLNYKIMDIDELPNQQDATVNAGEIASSSSGATHQSLNEVLNSTEEEVAAPSSEGHISSSDADGGDPCGETMTHNLTQDISHRAANNDTEEQQLIEISPSASANVDEEHQNEKHIENPLLLVRRVSIRSASANSIEQSLVENSNEEPVAMDQRNDAESEDQSEEIVIEGKSTSDVIAMYAMSASENEGDVGDIEYEWYCWSDGED